MQKKVTFRGLSPGSESRERDKSGCGGKIFLLSPAHMGGVRIQRLRAPESASSTAVRLRAGTLALGELFASASSLYFRGKLAYARRFATPPFGIEACHVITSSRGLLPANHIVDLALLEELASVALVDPENEQYRVPLQRTALSLREKIGQACEVVLLGSVATPKYVKPLLEIFGSSLLFPSTFAGRGNMSRGGLLLRSVREGVELDYVSATTLSWPKRRKSTTSFHGA